MRNKLVRSVLAAIVFAGACAPLVLSQLPGSSGGVFISTLTPCRAGLWGRVVVVRDAASASDCTVGGATGDAARAVVCMCDHDGAGGFVWRAAGGGGGGGGGVDSVSGSPPITSTGGADPIIAISTASTSARGAVELATSAETTAGLAVQASDTRLSDSRAPTGSASGDLTGTYPGPTVAANAVALGTDTTGNYAAGDNEAGAATNILDGLLVNADVNASAAIALSKLAPATASKCARFDGSGVLVPASGDCASGDTAGGVGGSTGGDDNRILRADGTGGSTLQASAVTVTDAGGISGLTQASVDDLFLDGSTISTISGDLNLAPGSGLVTITGASLRIMSGVPVMQFAFNGSFLSLKDTGKISWSVNGNANDTPDTLLERVSAQVVKVTSTIQIQDPGTKPTCDATTRGMHWLDAGGAGVADTYEICTKDAADAYAWRTAI